MRLLPDTLAGRTIATLLIGLSAFHVVSLWLYNSGFRAEIEYANERQLAERMVGMKQVIMAQPRSERDKMAHNVSGHRIEVHWGATSLVVISSTDPAALALRAHLVELVPELTEAGLKVAASHEGGGKTPKHSFVVSVGLPDESWVNFSIAAFDEPTPTWRGTILSTTAMAIAILALSIILVRSATAPLRAVTRAARRLGTGGLSSPVAVRGPQEARDAAMAFNEMQGRITRLVEDRVRTLAAVSHDLKSPLTRLRFRAELVPEHELREDIIANLTEMEAMIDTVLGFLRSEVEAEEAKPTDLASICASICSDFSDQGYDIALANAERAVLPVRRLMLKRAITNLAENGLKYGTRVRINVTDDLSQVSIIVDDDGPGIPTELMESAFEPFRRLMEPRAGTGGGMGLGLTVARTAARAHGGDVVLQNRPQGGLRALLQLPKADDGEVPSCKADAGGGRSNGTPNVKAPSVKRTLLKQLGKGSHRD